MALRRLRFRPRLLLRRQLRQPRRQAEEDAAVAVVAQPQQHRGVEAALPAELQPEMRRWRSYPMTSPAGRFPCRWAWKLPR